MPAIMKRLGNAFATCVMPETPSPRKTVRIPELQRPKGDLDSSTASTRSPSSTASSKTASPQQDGEELGQTAWSLGDGCLRKATDAEDVCPQAALEEHRKSGAAFIDRRYAHEVKQPGDGSCLFHALAFGLKDGTNARRLRREVSHYINDNPNMDIAGMTLQDWVKLDCGRSIKRYATKIAGGAEGGAIEIEVFSKIKGVNVHVYERCSGGYRRTCCFDGHGPSEGKGTVNILYRKRCHYDALVLEREFARL